MGHVFAKSDCVAAWEGGQTFLAEGQVWDEDADLVRARPDLFTDEPPKVLGRPDGPRVESATRAPGERRVRTRKRS